MPFETAVADAEVLGDLTDAERCIEALLDLSRLRQRCGNKAQKS
jgi:hypothetical protein